MKALSRKRAFPKPIAPIVAVADDQRREVCRFAEEVMLEDVVDLPMPEDFGQAQMKVDKLHGPFRRVDHHDLRAAHLVVLILEGYLMVTFERPTGQDEVSIAAVLDMDVELIEVLGKAEVIGQELRLIVEFRAADAPVDFLEADQVGVLFFNDLDNSLDPVPAIAAADSLVNVVANQPHVGFESVGPEFPAG